MSEAPVLSVSGLTTSFRIGGVWFPVVRNVSFSIEPGETLALVGESGSGKSVCALSILRLVSSGNSRIEGSVKLGGSIELLSLPESRMRQIRGNDIAMIFQEPMTSLNPVLTIGAQIAESLILHRGMTRAAANAEALRLLDKVRIPEAKARFSDYPHRFSGGMRQRVMIAMALACKPKLLIADEPTTALDVTIQAQILELIKMLQDEEGMSVLFITHDMGVVAEIADRMVVMYKGEAVESGSTADIFARAEHPYTRSLLAAVPRLGSMRDEALPVPFTGAVSAYAPDCMSAGTANADRTAGERPLLHVSGLTTRFPIRSGPLGGVRGYVHAVENVSFSLQSGETLALVGESGCGKSTTGRSVMRLVEPAQGSVLLDGVDVLKLGRGALRERRKLMQMIFQDPFASLSPRLKIGEAIAEPLIINGLASRKEAQDRVAELLRLVRLDPDMAERFPYEFSGGQRQRICIARALAVEPRLIVADEAVSALDVSVKAQVTDLMLELQARMKLAFLFISHDMAVVERMSHRVAVMYLGEIVEIGPRAAVFGNPQHPYTQRLLAAVPVPDPARRLEKRPVNNDEVKSAVRTLDYVPPRRQYREISPGHAVML